MKRVHYEVRGAHSLPTKFLTLPRARSHVAWLSEPGRLMSSEVAELRIVRITVENVPSLKRVKR